MEGEHVVPGVTDNPKPPDQLSTWMDANPASQGGGWRPDMVCYQSMASNNTDMITNKDGVDTGSEEVETDGKSVDEVLPVTGETEDVQVLPLDLTMSALDGQDDDIIVVSKEDDIVDNEAEGDLETRCDGVDMESPREVILNEDLSITEQEEETNVPKQSESVV